MPRHFHLPVTFDPRFTTATRTFSNSAAAAPELVTITPEFFTNATRQLCSSRAILSNIFISFLEKLYYTDLLLFFVLILKSSRSDRIMREFKTVAVEYDVRALTFFIGQVGITCAQIVRVSI